MSGFDRFEVPSADWREQSPAVSAGGQSHVEAVLREVERLAQGRRLSLFNERQWFLLLRDMEAFAKRWLEPAMVQGWSIAEIYGVPSGRKPFSFCRAGLVFMLGGNPVDQVERDRIVVANATGPGSTFYRKSPGCSVPFDFSSLVPIWVQVRGGVLQ